MTQLARLVACVALLGVTCASPSPVGKATLAALRGDGSGARALLSSRDDDAASQAVLASVALDEGDLAQAARRVARLRQLDPGAAEVVALQSFTDERRQGRDWMAAYVATLIRLHPLATARSILKAKDAGRGERLPRPDDAVLRRLDRGERFLLRWAWPEDPRADLTVEALTLTTDERLLVQLAVVHVLWMVPTGQRPPEVTAAWRELTRRMEQARPGVLRLLAVEQRREHAPVTEEEVAAMERAAAPDPVPREASEYTEWVRFFDRVEPAVAPMLAVNVMGLLTGARYLPRLSHRAPDPELPEALRGRLGRALARLADAADREGTMLTAMLGGELRSRAAVLLGDPTQQARADAVRLALERWSDAQRCMELLPPVPIRSLPRALIADISNERARLEALVRAGVLCPTGR